MTIEIASDDFLESSDTYQLINVEGGKYMFKDLTVKESHTFLETTYTAEDDVVLDADHGLTSENDLFNNKTVKATESSKTLAESLLVPSRSLTRAPNSLPTKALRRWWMRLSWAK